MRAGCKPAAEEVARGEERMEFFEFVDVAATQEDIRTKVSISKDEVTGIEELIGVK